MTINLREIKIHDTVAVISLSFGKMGLKIYFYFAEKVKCFPSWIPIFLSLTTKHVILYFYMLSSPLDLLTLKKL